MCSSICCDATGGAHARRDRQALQAGARGGATRRRARPLPQVLQAEAVGAGRDTALVAVDNREGVQEVLHRQPGM